MIKHITNPSEHCDRPDIKYRPLVSIIIPCFNLGLYIEDAIDSVLKQTYKNWELIIIDDGSTDKNTIKKIKDLSERWGDNSSVKIIFQENSGLSQTRNNGIYMANGVFVICLDADDTIEPTYVEECLKVFEKNSNVDSLAIVTSWYKEFGLRAGVWKPVEYDIPSMFVTNQLHAASMFRTDAFRQTVGYKTVMGRGYEDWEFWLSLIELGKQWKVVPKVLFNYRKREGSMLNDAVTHHDEIFKQLCQQHEALVNDNAVEITSALSQELNELRCKLNEQYRQNTKLIENESIVDELRAKVFEASNELNILKNSFIISKAIALRRLAGELRHTVVGFLRTLIGIPRRFIHKLRVWIAPLIPAVIRKSSKRAYRNMKSRSVKKKKYLVVKNSKWSNDLPLVSVIIPFYNAKDTIDETILSLEEQTLTDFEVIIVNDGSSEEDSCIKFDSLKSKSLALIKITQVNRGVASARNAGLRVAKGKYVMCLDSDDMLDPTYIEKAVVYLETHPNSHLFNCYAEFFGKENRIEMKSEYDPEKLMENNMVLTAAMYRKDSWRKTSGYKDGIGYEDWEYWIAQAENGDWGKTIPEALFKYRTSSQSRFKQDRLDHWENVRKIKELHKGYKKRIRSLVKKSNRFSRVIERKSALINLNSRSQYKVIDSTESNVLIAIPWMMFGGAETLIYNFGRGLKNEYNYNISFITGLKSSHEWEWKFKEITQNIYHLANLFDTEDLYIDFISNYIRTRNIHILHIVHTGYVFDLLPELKTRHPNLVVVVTMFNDRVEEYVKKSIEQQENIDIFNTDSKATAESYKNKFSSSLPVWVIPNGIDCYKEFNPDLFDREDIRASLGLEAWEKAIFFIGRISEEKNPDVFVEIAKRVGGDHDVGSVAKFFMIGDGPMKKEIEYMIHKDHVGNLTHLGYQSEIAKYLSAADIFVLPSRIEGFPLSILEAMSMGVAVVASRVGAIPDVITDGENGYIIEPGSSEQGTERVKLLLNNDTLLQHTRIKNRKDAEQKYSNKKLVENYRKLYKEMLK